MKTKLIGLGLFTATAVTVASLPSVRDSFFAAQATPAVQLPAHPPAMALSPQNRPRVDAVFVLDTTGSMSGLIAAAKEKIWSIATTMANAQPAPEIRIGIVAYRDRGDDYVTRVIDLSGDLDTVYAKLMDLQAGGGGDTPESVNQALHDAVHAVSWSQEPNAYKVVFLVGDAAPHRDYQDEVQYTETMKVAGRRGIVVNTVQCGQSPDTTAEWRAIASLGGGQYFQVDQAGSAVAVATPFDDKIAALAEKLDETRLAYGSDEDKRKAAEKTAAIEKFEAGASAQAKARRAVFNATESGKKNAVGERDLVADVVSGKIDLATVAPASLPAPLMAMSMEQRTQVLKDTAERRAELEGQVKELARQRSDYIEKTVGSSDAAKQSLDTKIYETVRAQAEAKGLRYEAGPAY